MTEQAALPTDTVNRVEALGPVDVVVGIPGFSNADTISLVAAASRTGLLKYFTGRQCLIVNSDAGSTDGTREIPVQESQAEKMAEAGAAGPATAVQILSTTYPGIPGKGSAFRAILEIARRAGCKTLITFDSDLRSITPEWVRALGEPIVGGKYDFVAPYYARHKFDGTITNSIVYPVTRALYGKRVRQPIGGDFAISAPLIERLLSQDVWRTDVARFGIDIWATSQAICGGFKVCQAFLGEKVHSPRDPGSALSTVLSQVVGALFQEMDRNASVWQKIRGSVAVPVLGNAADVSTAPVAVDPQRMIESFRLGHKNLQDIWGTLLSPATMLELKRVAQLPGDRFEFPDETWAHVVYDFSLGYRLRIINRDHLLRALTPLYLGWVASFVIQMKDAGPREVEERLEKLCLTYEERKPYLISRWRWPDRFSP